MKDMILLSGIELSVHDKKRLVSIDEHLKNLWIKPTRGRSKRGTNAYTKLLHQKELV